MITPATIQKKDFTRGVRGYKEEEVDQFLDLIVEDLGALLRENAALKENAKALTRELDRLKNSEASILGTLEAAKALMSDISASAEKRADIVLKNAEMEADRIRREARESVELSTEEAKALSRRWELFSARFRDLLETELERFDSFSANVLFDEAGLQKPSGRRAVSGAGKPAFTGGAGLDKTFVASKQ
ncbi:MAG: DivIVA domain-containing protein [Clostridiales bacterium]|nr:DivIVA domain-containing protein [Clostridiales bacterium]